MKKNWCDLIIHIIAAPDLPEFKGYVIMVDDENFTYQKDGTIKILHGNEWNSSKHEYMYMFELEEKIPGKRSKRFRYSEDEVIALYGHPSFFHCSFLRDNFKSPLWAFEYSFRNHV